MKRMEWGSKSHPNIMETYDDFSEFFTTCDSREWNDDFYEKARTRYSDDDDWAGASYNQAREFMVYGYKESVKQTSSDIDKLQKQSIINKPKRQRDYVGFSPIIPNVINGYPKSMWNDKRKQMSSRVITILYDVSIACGISREEMRKRGAEITSYIMNIERLGYRVRIDVLDGFCGEQKYLLRIPIKNENNPINLKRISFPMTHTAFSRTLGFDWYERLPKGKYMGGYGTPIYAVDSVDRKKLFERILDGTEYYLNYKSDLNEVFKEFAEELK